MQRQKKLVVPIFFFLFGKVIIHTTSKPEGGSIFGKTYYLEETLYKRSWKDHKEITYVITKIEPSLRVAANSLIWQD